MTLDEAIKHAKDKAQEQRYYAYYEKNSTIYRSYISCAEEHEQLAQWLEELKELREIKEEYQKGMENSYATFMYNKAIDDFEDKILSYLKHDDYGTAMDILVIADELKKECAE